MCVHAKSLQSCPLLMLCHTRGCSPPGTSVYGDSLSKNTKTSCPPPGDPSDPGIKPKSGITLSLAPPGKPCDMLKVELILIWKYHLK